MIERNAPLYVESHDLARWVLERVEAWPEERGRTLRQPLAETACQLVTAVSLALTFPDTRGEHLREADETVVRLRMLLRLASELALLSPGGLRHAEGHLRAVGRMLGGWQRQLRRREETIHGKNSSWRDGQELQGTGSPATIA